MQGYSASGGSEDTAEGKNFIKLKQNVNNLLTLNFKMVKENEFEDNRSMNKCIQLYL